MRIGLTMMGLLLAGCPGGPPEDTDLPSVISWSPIIEADARGAYLMGWSDGAGDMWVVGGQPETGIVLRGGVGGLTEVPLPEGTPLLNWVDGSGPDDVWVGGINGTVLHWDGSSWTDRGWEAEEAVWGLFVEPGGDVWAVGGVSAWGGSTAQVRKWESDSWTSFDLPEEHAKLGNLFKVHHDGSSVWSCGFQGAVVRSTDGAAFTAVGTGYAMDIITVDGLEGESPIFVGGRGTGAILEVAGDSLAVTANARSGLSGIHVLPDGTAVVVGERGYAGLYFPATDTLEEALAPTEDVLHGVAVDPEGRAWAIGGNLYTSNATFEGSIWVGEIEGGP